MRSWLGRSAAVVAIGLAVLAGGTPAWAQSVIPLRPAHQNQTAQGFSEHRCDGPFTDLPPNQDGWHFVLPASAGENFVTITLTYSTPNGQVIVQIPPGAGPGWTGFFDNAGDNLKHAYVITDAGWTLVDGTSTVATDGDTGYFNLSHTCPGTPVTPSPTPSPTAPPTTAPPTTAPASASIGPVPSGGAGTGGGGSQGFGEVWLGLGALAGAGTAGLSLAYIRRRRTG